MIIYKITNLINGKIYIGQTKKDNKNYYGSGTLVKKAIKKYGKINFLKEILNECSSIEELNKMEIYWIEKLNSTNTEIGYNIEIGGSDNNIYKKRKKGDYIFTKSHKSNISKGLLGKEKSEKHKFNISKNHNDVSGINNPMFGKTHSIKVKKFLKEINIGRIHTKGQLVKMKIKSSGENNSNSKLTKQEIIKIREMYKNNYSLIEIANIFNVKFPCIHKIVTYKTWKNI